MSDPEALYNMGVDFAPVRGTLLPRSFAREGVFTASGIGPTLIVSEAQIYNRVNSNYPRGLLGRSETAIAAANDGRTIVQMWNTAQGFLSEFAEEGLTASASSTDSGASFDEPQALPALLIDSSHVVCRGDPWLDVGPDGLFYSANLAAFEGPFTPVGILVHRGSIQNGGIRWDNAALIRPPGPKDILDKEALAVDKRAGERRVYVSATNFLGTGGTRIELYRSSNGGGTWAGPAVVKSPDYFGQQGSAVAVGASGEVYVAWERGRLQDSSQILLSTSRDGGGTFTPFTVVASIVSTSQYGPVGYNRTVSNDFPRIAVDYSSAHTGRLFVAYQDAGRNRMIHTDGVYVDAAGKVIAHTGGVADGDVYLKYSDDGGSTWSGPVLVSSATAGDGRNQFWPVVSVAPDGTVHILYYQDNEVQPVPFDSLATNMGVGGGLRRRSSYQSLVDVYWAQSHDGGETFDAPVRINDVTSNWSTAQSNITPNFGDYIAATAAAQSLYCSWAQAFQYDIDPGPVLTQRFVPSAAFAVVTTDGSRPPRRREPTPQTYALGQNYPNPFNPRTSIAFSLGNRGRVELKVFNILGGEVATLVDEERDAGEYSVSFDGSSFASGIYIYRLLTDEFRDNRKMMLIK